MVECEGGKRGEWYCGLGNGTACEDGRTFELGRGDFADFRGEGEGPVNYGGEGGKEGEGKVGVDGGKGKAKGGEGDEEKAGKDDGDGKTKDDEAEGDGGSKVSAATVTVTEAATSASAIGTVTGNRTAGPTGTSQTPAQTTGGAARLDRVRAIGMSLMGVAAVFLAGL